MASLARTAIVWLTALPLLASQGWCCVAWSLACGDVRMQAHQAQGDLAPALSAGASCCNRASKPVAVTGAELPNPAPTTVQSGPCECCSDLEITAVVSVAKDALAATSALAANWTPIVLQPAPIATPVEISPSANEPPLRVLHCVWRC